MISDGCEGTNQEMISIGIVLVTFNRLEKLKIALDCFEKQTMHPQYIIVVNNASNDGTKEYLEQWKSCSVNYERIVIHMSENLGGSGGFHNGLNFAIKKEANWIWVSDDDAFPENDVLFRTADYIEKNNSNNLSAICGAVINEGKIDLKHRKNMIRKGINIIEEYIPESEYKKDEFELNCFSYVGTIINKQKLKIVGVTLKDYFLWWDDTEHSLRLSRVGKIICIPAIRIHHNVGCSNKGFTWKTYYGFRNMADVYRRHFPNICYIYYVLKLTCKTYYMDILKKNKEENKAIRCSLRDCRKGKFGVHSTYKPGWEPQSRS